jgi:hypothetical protein
MLISSPIIQKSIHELRPAYVSHNHDFIAVAKRETKKDAKDPARPFRLSRTNKKKAKRSSGKNIAVRIGGR